MCTTLLQNLKGSVILFEFLITSIFWRSRGIVLVYFDKMGTFPRELGYKVKLSGGNQRTIQRKKNEVKSIKIIYFFPPSTDTNPIEIYRKTRGIEGNRVEI